MTETSSTQTSRNPLLMRLVFLILLIGLLIGTNLLYQYVANWNKVLSGETGELLYAAGFDGFEDEWTLFDGRESAEIADGVLRLSLENPRTFYNASSPTYADFDVTVTTRAIEGELQNDGYGIIFRLSETSADQSCLRQYITVCQLEQLPLLDTLIGTLSPAPQPDETGYYLFMISNDGFYQLLRFNNASEQAEEMTIWHNGADLLNVGVGEENRIRVVGQGNQFSFFLNGEAALLCVPLEGQLPTGTSEDCLGEETFVWEDNTFATGKLGVVLSGTNDIVEFDNFTVKMPDAIIFEGNNA